MIRLSRFPLLALTAAALLWMAACSPRVQAEQLHMTANLPIEAGKNLGQTFLSRYDGLQGIAVHMRPENPGSGTLTLRLFDSPIRGDLLAEASIPLAKVDHGGYYRFNFEPNPDSARADFYLRIEQAGEGSVRAALGPEEDYLNGAAYRNDEPLDAQLAFRLVYHPRLLALGLLEEIFRWSGILVYSVFLYVIPGWGLLRWLYPAWKERRLAEKLGLAASVSLAIYPLLYLWTDLVGLHLGAVYAWLPPIFALAYLLWVNLLKPGSTARLRQFSSRNGRGGVRSIWHGLNLADFAYLVVIFLIFGARFWAVRMLDVPMWGDSYHHTLVAQLLSDNRGLFDSWSPYAEVTTFTYHFGFHTLIAGLMSIGGFTASAATLWTGQIINGLAVICLYPLAVKLGRNSWAGVVAVLFAGLLAPMPMGYVNWGRYTQLAGQVILAGVVYLIWESFQTQKSRPALLALTALSLAGLALTHLRVLIIAVLFIAGYLLLELRSGRVRSLFARGLILGIAAGLLYLPWFVHTYSGQIMAIFTSQITTPASQVPQSADQVSTIGNLFDYLPAIAWLLLSAVLGWGLWRRDRGTLLMAVWWGLVWIAGEPGWYGLPGTGAVTTFAVLIAAYFPAALILGAAVGWGMEPASSALPDAEAPGESPRKTRFNRRIIAEGILLSAVVIASLMGIQWRQGDVQVPEHALVLRPDLRAFQWIDENLPPEARFLVNAQLTFGESTTTGTDAGWWLPLLARRQTTIPPMNYTFEAEPRPGYREWINALYVEIEDKGIDDPDVLDMLVERGVGYVYIGQQQGSVSPFGTQCFDLAALQASPHYQQVYHQDRVWIFEVIEE